MYALDTNAARSADARGSFIDETGKYVGTFTRAEEIVSRQGTKGIGFTFKANDGRTARFDIYTERSDGSVLNVGRGQVMAMMACLSLRKIEATLAVVKKWDSEASAERDVRVPCYVDLMGKPVGVLLEVEEYAKQDGSTGRRMSPAGVFQADTELMASEILDRKTQPQQLAKLVASLRDRPLKDKPAQQRGAPQQRGGSGSGSGGASFDDMDSDIPF